MFITPSASHDTCHISCVTCQVSGVTCRVSHVTSNSQTVRARELKFSEKVHLLPPVTCHMSCVTCNVSRITSHLSLVTCNFFCFLFMLVVEGPLLMGSTPSSLRLETPFITVWAWQRRKAMGGKVSLPK